MNEKKFPQIDLPQQNFSLIGPRTSSLVAQVASQMEGLAEEANRATQEKIMREERTIDLLEKLVQLGQEKPEVISNINTLINNSTINNMQNNYDNSSGVQHIVSNSGLTSEEFSKLIDDFRELTDILSPTKSKETSEIVEELNKEIRQAEPRKGIIKASLAYLFSFVNDIITDPVKVVAKKEFAVFAMEKAQHIKEVLHQVINFFSS